MIDLTQETAKLKGLYQKNYEGKVCFVVYGGSGTGKTRLLETCPPPVLVDSFDPGGLETVEEAIKDGRIIPDSRWEKEDFLKPWAFSEWEKEFERRRREGMFIQVGTYCIDSLTTWSEALMNATLMRAGRARSVPQIQDYQVLIRTTLDYVKLISELPCFTVLNAHIQRDQDQVSGRIMTSVLLSGKAADKLPLYVSEMYVSKVDITAKGPVYSLLTQSDGLYTARTRMGRDLFQTNEPPDISALLRKAGKIK